MSIHAPSGTTAGRKHKHMNTIKTRLGYITATATALALSAASALALGTADAAATGVLDDAKATFDYAKPIGLGIMGTFLGVAILVRVWKRFAK